MKQRRRGTAEQAADIKKHILKFATNPLITLSDIAELLKVSPQYVQQVTKADKGLLEKREADRLKYFANLSKSLPKIQLPKTSPKGTADALSSANLNIRREHNGNSNSTTS